MECHIYSVQIKIRISEKPNIYQIIQFTINAKDSVTAIEIALAMFHTLSISPIFMIQCYDYIGPDIINYEKMEPINVTEMIEGKEEDEELP